MGAIGRWAGSAIQKAPRKVQDRLEVIGNGQERVERSSSRDPVSPALDAINEPPDRGGNGVPEAVIVAAGRKPSLFGHW